jgi:hypothetical protein
MLAMYSSNQVETNLYVDGNIVYTTLLKEISVSILHPKKEKDMNKIFHIMIQIIKTKVYALFDSNSKANVIAKDIVRKIGLEVHVHPRPYPLGWVNNDAKLWVAKWCKIKFSISSNYINEVKVDILPLDVCVVVFGIPYMYKRDAIFMRREN